MIVIFLQKAEYGSAHPRSEFYAELALYGEQSGFERYR